MQQKISPVFAVILGIIVLAGVGFLSLKLFGPSSAGGTEVRVKMNNPNDPKFKPDPHLAGGGANGAGG